MLTHSYFFFFSYYTAVSQLTSTATMILDDGTYTGAFDIPPGLDGFTIKSASNNAYAYV